jgi:hypothetical protein
MDRLIRSAMLLFTACFSDLFVFAFTQQAASVGAGQYPTRLDAGLSTEAVSDLGSGPDCTHAVRSYEKLGMGIATQHHR